MLSYIFGGDTGLTPEDVKRQRMIANALAESRTPQNAGEGVGAVMRGIAGALVNARANRAETLGRQSATEAMNPIIEALKNPFGADTSPSTNTADFTTDPTTKSSELSPATTPEQVAEIATKNPVDGTIENARKDDRSSVAGFSSDVRGFQKVLRAGKGWTEVVGPDGATLRREGTRNWRNNNPGNIEYGDFAKKLGAIGTDGRFAVFPTYESGRKAKESLLFENPNYRDKTISSAITRYAPPVENNTNAYISSVANAIGVDPNTPLSDLTPQQRTIMLDAMQKVEGFRPGREFTLDGKATQAPVEVASLDGNIPLPAVTTSNDQNSVAAVPEGFEQPDPLKTKPVEVAEASQTPTTKRRGNEPSDEDVIKVLMNPWADDTQRGITEMYLKQRQGEREFQRKLEAERNDPKYKLELEKLGIETENLRNPKKARTLTEADEKALNLNTSGVYQELPDGSVKTVQEPTKRNTTNVDGRIVDTDTGKVIADFSKEPANWDKLDDGTLFNKSTGEIKNVQGQTVGFRFPGNSTEAAALNGLIDAGRLTPEEAMNIAAGKQMTGPNGEIMFATPQALIGANNQKDQRQDGGIDIFAGQQPSDVPAVTPTEKPAEQPIDAVPVIEQSNNGMVPLTPPKVSIDERKAAGFADRMNLSSGVLNELENFAANPDTKWEQGYNSLPLGVGNFLTSENFKRFDNAKRDFINAQLRRESGAVISDSEFANAEQQYFPQPGDPPEVIKQKRELRKTALDSMMRDAGPTYKAPKIEPKKASEQDDAPPADLPDEIKDTWQYLTPEERKLWQN